MCVSPRWGEAYRLSLDTSYLGWVPAFGVAVKEESSLVLVLQAGWGKAGRGTPEPPGQNQHSGDIRAMPSDDAVIAQYSLGAALSCDALEWKHAVGLETLSSCLLRCVLCWEG